MANLLNRFGQETRIVGNDYVSNEDAGFKADVKGIFESYAGRGVDLTSDLNQIISRATDRREFEDSIMESFQGDPMFTDSRMANSMFYNNYADRFGLLLDNSLTSVAIESVTQGYHPIVAYNPFFLKKQWVACIFKDVLMTEVPNSPVINLAFERRYIKTADGTKYEMPDVFYDDEAMKKLSEESQGVPMDATKEIALPLKNVDILTAEYFPAIGVITDRAEMLNQSLEIAEVHFATEDVWVPAHITADATTHAFPPKVVSDGTDGGETDTLVGNVDFEGGRVTIVSTSDKIDKIKMNGKLSNRWNERGLTVIRENEQIQKQMPESGPRLNTAVTVEEAADALALQRIDMIADNVDMMGRTLAELEDYEIRTFLDNSFTAQEAAAAGPFGYEKLTVSASFNALPYDGFTNNITDWMKDSREYFERVINSLKQKLKSPDVVIVAVAHPELIRFLQDGIDWVFSDDTQISGIKISYKFGILTTAQDRVHIITSHYLKQEKGIQFIVIPTTKELITFKHYKYNMVIDRGYRNPTHQLVPNIMATQRTLTFEVLPVQGRMTITGRDFTSPETLTR